MKEVYDTRQIAHLWAHKSQRSARNKQGNFSFSCADLRSYSTVIATRVERKGETVFLLASRRWSNTTNRHQSLAWQAAYGNIFAVADWQPTTYRQHKANVQDFIRRATESAAKAKRARSYGENHLDRARELLDQAKRYAALFGVRGKIPAPTELDALAATVAENAKRAAAQASAAKKKRDAALKAYNNAAYAALPNMISAWRAGGENLRFHYNGASYTVSTYALSQANGGALMRFNPHNQMVETNQGASVPAGQVRRLAPLLLRAMQSRKEEAPHPGAINPDPIPEFTGRHVGPFVITKVTADTVTVGCHVFTRAEIQNILAILQLAEVIPTQEEAPTT